MDGSNSSFEAGISFDNSDLLFQNNSQFFSEIEEFPGYGPVDSNNDFNNQSLTMQDLQIPFQPEGWAANYPGEFTNYSGVEFQQNFQNQSEFKSENFQSCPNPGYIPAQDFSSFPPAPHYQTERMQYLGPPQDYPKPKETSQSPNTPSDYYSGNSSPHSSTSPPTTSSSSPTTSSSPPTTSTSSIPSRPARNKKTLPTHNVGNLPDGLMKALTTVLSKTNNTNFKQLMQSNESQTANKKLANKSSNRKLASRPNIDSSKRVPIVKPVPLGNKPSLEEVRKKKAERMIRNREAALQSRKRKLEEQAVLEETCRDLQDRNIQLEKQVSFLEGRLSQIEETNRKLETQLSKFSRPSKVLASVCFLMFVSLVAFSVPGPNLSPSYTPSNHEFKSRMLTSLPAQPMGELHWLLSPIYQLWNRASWMFTNDREKYELAIPRNTKVGYSYAREKYEKDFIDNQEYRTRERYMRGRKLDNSIIAYPQQEWPAGLNSTQMHSDFVHLFKNLSVSKDHAVSTRGNTNMARPMMLRFPPEGIPIFSKFLNETSFIFESLQPEFKKRPQNLFVVALDHALWIPSHSTPNQTLSIIIPSPRDIDNYFPWLRWDCVVTGYQEFLTPIPSSYYS